MIEQAVSLEPFRVIGGFWTTTQTDERNGSVVGILRFKGLSERVTGDHSKSIRESKDLFTVVAGSSEVVG